jgi:hypothetical protein
VCCAGEYLCNVKSLGEFRMRNTKLKLPTEPTFVNTPFESFAIDKGTFAPAADRIQNYAGVPEGTPQTFQGFPRQGGR